MIWVLIGLAVIATAAVWLVVTSPSKQDSGVADFRRHIDALSPEARRKVIDRAQPPRPDEGND